MCNTDCKTHPNFRAVEMCGRNVHLRIERWQQLFSTMVSPTQRRLETDNDQMWEGGRQIESGRCFFFLYTV